MSEWQIVIDVERLSSPIGALTVAARGARLCLLHFGSDEAGVRRALERWYPGETIAAGKVRPARAALDAYFSGNLTALDAVEVEMHGTAFQRRVWDALRRIPAGTTSSYGALANTIGEPTAVRAVGAANGANPIAVIVPCHRVIGANGSLTGYGGGLDRKRWLLAHEARHSGLFRMAEDGWRKTDDG